MRYWYSVSASDPLNFAFAKSMVVPPQYNDKGARSDIEGYVTYPDFFTGNDGVFRLKWRQGWSNVGQIYVYEYDSATTSWSNPLGRQPVRNGWVTDEYRSPYPDRIEYNPADDFYYMSYTWRTRSSVAALTTINLIRTKDFKSWTSAAGTPLPPPYSSTTPTPWSRTFQKTRACTTRT
ncbi:BNR-4 repeat-containing protein [Mycetocola tolaasinivorans]|nr:BNR-4 repeat-containing protein [Mycetocola tolaasinivorans]